jgi:protoheme ferro-lyase
MPRRARWPVLVVLAKTIAGKSPRETAEAYRAAILAGDLDGFLQFAARESRAKLEKARREAPADFEAKVNLALDYLRPALANAVFREAEVQGERAVVVAEGEVGGARRTVRLQLVKEDGIWKVEKTPKLME